MAGRQHSSGLQRAGVGCQGTGRQVPQDVGQCCPARLHKAAQGWGGSTAGDLQQVAVRPVHMHAHLRQGRVGRRREGLVGGGVDLLGAVPPQQLAAKAYRNLLASCTHRAPAEAASK